MQDTTFPVRSLAFIKRRRKEFNVTKRVLDIQLEEQHSHSLIRAKEQHEKELTNIAEIILTHFVYLQPSGDGYTTYIYSPDETPARFSRQDVIDQLCENIREASVTSNEYNLFNYFIIHILTSNSTIQDLYQYAKDNPIELVDTLKLSIKRGFKGKCPICRDW